MTPATPSAGLDAALSNALAERGWRVRRLELPQGRVWVKRVERLSFRLRLQKGDPKRGLEAERAALKRLAAAGIAVPPLLAEGPDWIALPDAGADLRSVLRDPPAAALALPSAARALAALHAGGFAHGRLVLRDICWDGTTARFIDLERCPPDRASLRQQALDLVFLVQSWFAAATEAGQALDGFFAEYRQATGVEGAEILRRAGRLARRSFWIVPLARLGHRLRPQSREAAAVPLALAWLRRF